MVSGAEEFKLKRLRELGVHVLEDDEKTTLRERRSLWDAAQDSIKDKTRDLYVQIRELEGQLDKDVPSIPGADCVHGKQRAESGYGCGLKAAVYYGQTPSGGSAGGDHVYFCLYCNKEFLGDGLGKGGRLG